MRCGFLTFLFIRILTFLVFFSDYFFLCKVCLSAIITERFGRFFMDCVKENINLRNEIRTRTVFFKLLFLGLSNRPTFISWGKTSSIRLSLPIDINKFLIGFFANWIWSSLNKFGGQRSALKNQKWGEWQKVRNR